MSRRLIEAHEEERTWVARELHDDVNQRLALLAVTLDVVKLELPASAREALHQISEAREQVKDLGHDVQALSHRLHSSKLEYLGLASAGAAFCKEFSEGHEVQIDFSCEGVSKTLSKEISLCLFRVLQEAIRNATEHSSSRHFQVCIACVSDQIHLTVQDSGTGFDVDKAAKGSGLGITSMRERLKLVGGELSIESGPQKGTTVRAMVPVGSSKEIARAAKA